LLIKNYKIFHRFPVLAGEISNSRRFPEVPGVVDTLLIPLLSSDLPSAITETERPFNGPFSGTTQVSRYQKGKTNLDFTEARDSEWQWHQLGHMRLHLAPDR